RPRRKAARGRGDVAPSTPESGRATREALRRPQALHRLGLGGVEGRAAHRGARHRRVQGRARGGAPARRARALPRGPGRGDGSRGRRHVRDAPFERHVSLHPAGDGIMTPFARISVAPFEELAHRIEGVLDGDNQDAILGSELTALVARIPTEAQVTPGALVRLALLNDALCLAERVMNLDGVLSERELSFVEPLVREALHYLPRFRSFYRVLDIDGPGGVANFLKHHTSDGQKFGGRCKS